MNGPEARIIDANLNRAAEAARVLEDAARFILDRPDLSGALKDLRHGLARGRELLAAAGLDAAALGAWRDTPGDRGTCIQAERESRRGSMTDIAAANGHRLAEALRTLEEAAKLTSVEAAAWFERLRYDSYELARRVEQLVGPARVSGSLGVCVLITGSLCAHMPWDRVAEEAIAGGASMIQLREKDLPDRELLRRARRLVEIAAGAPSRPGVIVNDRVEIALMARADGVHLGQDDLDARDARRLAGARLFIGISTSNLAEARAAAEQGADLCGVGPMFPTETKHKPELAGPDYLREYLADPITSRIPHLAIGGITPENVGTLAALGCRGVAVSGAVCKSQRPAVICRALCEELTPPPAGVRGRGGQKDNPDHSETGAIAR